VHTGLQENNAVLAKYVSYLDTNSQPTNFLVNISHYLGENQSTVHHRTSTSANQHIKFEDLIVLQLLYFGWTMMTRLTHYKQLDKEQTKHPIFSCIILWTL
jgi:hypothetical protein